jgi:radical SAM protein with 4Fe4S-binding SPASM domain
VRGHIRVSGGEPFIRQDFFDLLEVFCANRNLYDFSILTNGSYIDDATAQGLEELRPVFVQVSLEGAEETNDFVRGPGAFGQTVAAVNSLVRARINTRISFTAHKGNSIEFAEVARIGRKLGVQRVWSDRLIPWGAGSNLAEQLLSPHETREFFELMHKAHGEAVREFCKTEISMHRALQFLVAGGEPYHCGAGESLITVMPNGDLYPCRRMPIKVGNILETPLVDMYYDSELLRDLRSQDKIIYGCERCSFSRSCRGGLRCLSYAITGDPFTADPGCWRV